MNAAEQVLLLTLRRRRRHWRHIEMCCGEDCHATRLIAELPALGWSRICISHESFMFCPRCGPQKAIDAQHTPAELRRLKACIERCRWLVRARDN